MHIKTGDNVIVITGIDKGKTGKVIQAFPSDNKVIVEGINMRKRHQRPTRDGAKGQIVERANPINVSNLRKADGAAKPVKAKVVRKTKAKKADAETKAE